MKIKKIFSAVLIAALAAAPTALLSGCAGGVSNAPAPAPVTSTDTGDSSTPDDSGEASQGGDTTPISVDFGLRDKISEGVILHAWTWSFNTIKETMTDIAAAGYSTIQVSPVNAIVGADKGMELKGKGMWYYQYQPVNFTIGNYQVGTEEEFKAMCAEADKYGIKIIVDVVPNHMTSEKDKIEQSFIDACGGKEAAFHKGVNEGVSNYSDRLEVTTHSFLGLQDVNTENPKFQEYFINYLNQLIADGADGFRYDTAKHIGLPSDPQEDPNLPNNFWEQVTTKIDKADTIFNYGEVLQDGYEKIEEYIKAIGHTTASRYGDTLKAGIRRHKLKIKDMPDFMTGGSTDVVTWVESHDNYLNDGSYKLTDDQIILGWAIVAGQGEGTPLFYDRPYDSSPQNMFGPMNRIGAAGNTFYKNQTVKAINHFRNAMVGEETVVDNIDKKPTMLSVTRGSKGLILTNLAEADEELNIDTKLPDGTYPDRGGQCGEFTVSGGKLTGTLKAGCAAILYNEGYVEPIAMPDASVETDSFKIEGDSLKVTLHVSGADKGTYTLNGTEAEFSDGDTVDVTAGSDGTGVLKVSATNENGLTSNMTYWFTSKSGGSSAKTSDTPADGTTISFTKPDTWGDDINIYIYQEEETKENAAWPGEPMTNNGDGTYSYTLKEGAFKEPLIIFNDGTKQYPKSKGLALEEGKMYTIES